MSTEYIVSTFYQFVKLHDIESWKNTFLDFCNANNIKGTILVAEEGINSTLTATRKDMDKFYTFIHSFEEFAGMGYKESISSYMPFKKMKVRLKKEIVKLLQDDFIDMEDRGEHLKYKEWNDLLKDPQTKVIDTRNDYEFAFGTFENAINPHIRNFTDLPEWVEKNLKDTPKDTPIAMFCTGGIRCEKSTAYMKAKGWEKVYHLDGGILQYFEDTPKDENLWNGRCFVFDDRIAVDTDLNAMNESN
ncbi:UNVERIFIED_CONTAM: hypothetical protein GTU68_027682 [Idotea baltica]|nr:hypothetical protein [Idotea baltica]